MRKLIQMAAMGLLLTGLVPALALANNTEHGNLGIGVPNKLFVAAEERGKVLEDLKQKKDHDDNDNEQTKTRVFNGTVTATTTTGFTLQSKDNKIFTVNATGAKIVIRGFGQAMTLAEITVGSNALVRGTLNGTIITAEKIEVIPANTHRAVGRGTITAVNTNSFTLQMNNHGIISSATVNTSANTTVMQNGSTTTTASLKVGSKVAVKGLWDEILNVLNAIRVKIF